MTARRSFTATRRLLRALVRVEACCDQVDAYARHARYLRLLNDRDATASVMPATRSRRSRPGRKDRMADARQLRLQDIDEFEGGVQ